jgi:phenylacetate-CoA ligase
MPLDIENLPLISDPYSHERMSFLKPQNALDLVIALQLYLIEQGPRQARENWQRAQLSNLAGFATERSAFWKSRLGDLGKGRAIKLSALPVLTRFELNRQVADERCLIRPTDGLPYFESMTSGSSGTPTTFFVTDMNRQFSNFTALLDNIMYPFEASYNKTRVNYEPELKKACVVSGEITDFGLRDFVRPQNFRTIVFNGSSTEALIRELTKQKIGELTTYPWVLDILLRELGVDGLRNRGCRTLILLGGNVETDVIREFGEASINLRSTYSCREVGPIGVSCKSNPGIYHIKNTNVIVEVASGDRPASDGERGNVLITGLHTYATPFIRYEVGDIATFYKRCPCGYDGPAIGEVYGRSKSYIKLADGSLVHFLPTPPYYELLSNYKEYRFIQTETNKMQIFIGGRTEISAQEREAFLSLINSVAGPDMSVEIICRDEIDWGKGGKRLPFRCDVP